LIQLDYTATDTPDSSRGESVTRPCIPACAEITVAHEALLRMISFNHNRIALFELASQPIDLRNDDARA
jgi:hypothetical protein